MSPDVVGKNLGGVTVRDATENGSLIEAADLAIITGMTLPNRTLPASSKPRRLTTPRR